MKSGAKVNISSGNTGDKKALFESGKANNAQGSYRPDCSADRGLVLNAHERQERALNIARVFAPGFASEQQRQESQRQKEELQRQQDEAASLQLIQEILAAERQGLNYPS